MTVACFSGTSDDIIWRGIEQVGRFRRSRRKVVDGGAEHIDRQVGVGPIGKAQDLFKGRTPHDDRIDRMHEVGVAAVFASRYGCIGPLEPVDGAVAARDTAIQTGGDEDGAPGGHTK